MVGRGTGDAVPLRAAGALIGPDGLAVRWTRIGCACGAAGGPTAFWGGDRRASTMFRPPAKKACRPLMSGQRDVGARAGAAPTGAAATGVVPTPVREEPWPTRPQISVHCDSPSPSPGHDRGRFAAVFGSPQASLRPWPSSMVAAVPGWVLETPPPSFAGRAPLCALSRYVGVR